MSPGGSRSFAKPIGATSQHTPVTVPGAAVLATTWLGRSTALRPLAGARAVSPLLGLSRSAPARAIRPSSSAPHTRYSRSPRTAESSPLTTGHRSLPQ
ncbi:hypothetical protein NDU88_003516 [Pleurodeles waltl]|uniref:Uncharacterized protein n=1 Tax=Pleurodeles waltl TaxID=8319 RepID=A0AAV7W6G5_PLEWA|nr:hypothetical protein NDU88_003516 [Pleurodeles waltl]